LSDARNKWDALARPYRWLEYAVFGRTLERCRFGLIPHLQHARRVLTIGEGDGRFVAELARRRPDLEVDCVEGSAAMIARARARLPAAARVRFHHHDALRWRYPTASYDAVVTCFFLDCFDEDTLRRWMPAVQGALRPGGHWLVAEFRPAARGLRGATRRLLLASMYGFFGWTTALEARQLPNWAALLRDLGCRHLHSDDARRGMLESSVWSADAQPAAALAMARAPEVAQT